MTFLNGEIDRLVFLLYAALIFVPLERLLPRVRRQTWLRRNLALDLCYMIFGAMITVFLSMLFVLGVVTALGSLVPNVATEFVQAQPLWFQCVLLIILADFYYYWAHRLFHSVPVLWKFHAVHHSIEDLDWVAAHRTHPVDTAVTNSGALIIAVLLGFDAVAVVIFSLQFAWHSLLKHSNLKVSWGPLRWLYLTPTYHHWHHANSRDAYDKNFAGQFPLWDVLFGTAIMKEKEAPEAYGVDDPVPLRFLGSLIYPFRPALKAESEDKGLKPQGFNQVSAE